MIKYGFQTYTWQMSYQKYAGKMEHIAGVTNRGGLKFIEAEICMLGSYFDSPERLKEELAKQNTELGALCLVCDWINPAETADETLLADRAIKFAGHFDNLTLALGQMPQADRSDLSKRQQNALACIASVARRAREAGVERVVYHPNSPAGSAFRTHEDYMILLGGLDFCRVGFAPDSGHITKGGMDVYDIFKTYAPFIRHVHFKDIDAAGNWRVMGEGVTDFAELTKILRLAGYDGYVMIEDESSEAETDPDGVALQNAGYIKKYLI
ncbi:MAG: sugar phosphate isomerase/epimerase [Oscillospiraceae bacterium]|nr:sugar phosphate isomerase/epimerase [Oscillospiraceae bacterium]